MKTGVLLVNLGTPEQPTLRAVRRYLRIFLADKRVVDVPLVLRYILLYLFILPFRPKSSLAAYQKIWMKEGSPLLVYSQRMQQRLATALGSAYQVSLAMRYETPSIEQALVDMQDCTRIIVMPLFPQYASATTGSIVEKCYALLQKRAYIPAIHVLPEFYADPGFVAAYAGRVRTALVDTVVDRVIYSFHGLPVRHIAQSGCQVRCAGATPCPAITTKNRSCYRAQCYASARAIAEDLGLSAADYHVAFQSRLGKTPWIEPYTDELLERLALDSSVRDIAIVCPSFVADCLETLEEIGMALEERWRQLGGHSCILVPCLNDDPVWVEYLADRVRAA